MQRPSVSALLALLFGLFLGACASNTPAVHIAPAYDGPMPTTEGQKALHTLRGTSFQDHEGQLGGGVWTVGGFSVDENTDGALVPVLNFTQGTTKLQLPVLNNGDVNYIYGMVLGELSPAGGGNLSRELKTTLRSSRNG